MEVAGPVVPPRVHTIFRVRSAEHVDEAPLLQGGESVTFGLADMCRPDEFGGIVHVAIVGGDVVVAAHDDRPSGVGVGIEVRDESVEP